ncbi:MAG: hypothetical protein V7L07_31435 [Nostoc sp.]
MHLPRISSYTTISKSTNILGVLVFATYRRRFSFKAIAMLMLLRTGDY